jgi:uncharacterized protein
MIEKMMELSRDLYPLIAAVSAMLIAQLLKTCYFYARKTPINWKNIFAPGGMPSAHSAMVTALTMAIALKEGIKSTSFSLSLVFAIIILYDAAGVRRAAGKQAEVLNKIVKDFFEDKGLKNKKLAELLGHTPLEIFVGVLIGVLVALLLRG